MKTKTQEEIQPDDRYSISNPEANEILENIFAEDQGQTVTDEILKAMQEYADQQTADLRKKLDYQTERCKAAELWIATDDDDLFEEVCDKWQSLVNKESEIYNNE